MPRALLPASSLQQLLVQQQLLVLLVLLVLQLVLVLLVTVMVLREPLPALRPKLA